MIAVPLFQDEPVDLSDMVSWLTVSMEQDPFLLLVSAFEWLDPLGVQEPSEEWENPDGDNVMGVLFNTRTHASELYTQFVQERRWLSPQQLEYHMATELADYLHLQPGLLDLDWFVGAYLPFSAVGSDIQNPDWLEEHEWAWEIVEIVGENSYVSGRIADLLIHSLERTGNEVHKNVAMLLYWLYGYTGNTLFDNTDEDLYESGLEPYTWDDLDDAIYCQVEAYDFLDQVMAAHDALVENVVLWNAFIANVRTARIIVNSGEYSDVKQGREQCEFVWPDVGSDSGFGLSTTQVNAKVLRFWRDPQHERDGISREPETGRGDVSSQSSGRGV